MNRLVQWLIVTHSQRTAYQKGAHLQLPQKVCVTWLLHTCDMSHSYVTRAHGSFVKRKKTVGMCDMTHSNVTRAHWSFVKKKKVYVCVTWLIHTCDMSHSHVTRAHGSFVKKTKNCRYVWHDSFIRVTWLIHMWLGLMGHLWKIHRTLYLGWFSSLGSIKL